MVAFYADLDAMGALSGQLKSVHRMLSSDGIERRVLRRHPG